MRLIPISNRSDPSAPLARAAVSARATKVATAADRNTRDRTTLSRADVERGSPARPGSLREGIRVQRRVISALMIRDMMSRYGRSNIGFLWVVLEPMLLTSLVMVLWSALRSPYEHGVELVAIVLTGYMPLTLFRHLSQVGSHIYRNNMPFLYHRHISFIDVIVARALLEFIGTTAALVVVYTILVAFELLSPIKDAGLCVAGWFILAYLAFGLASVIAILSEAFDAAERFIQPFQYILLPLSGAFYMIDWLPTSAQHVAWFMPTAHCYEMFRAGFLGEEVRTTFAAWYPLAWATAMTAIGLGSIEYVRDRIHTG